MKLYDTLERKLKLFIPLEENKVGMYVCGPTVYNYIHVGNARPAVFFDTLRRYFEYKGYDVTYVQNFTDIDDKIINKANEEKKTIKEISETYIKAYLEDTKSLNIKEEGMLRPKATEYIGEMIKLTKTLIEKDYAYQVDGDVYFNVKKYENSYGVLISQDLEDLKAGARVEENTRKKSPLDFVLWKGAKEGEPAWNSPWGMGRPGWHLECSAMSHKLLGKTFDIHGGGQDLAFPHHENEIAQSKCYTDGEFARYWLHNGHVRVKGEKMSKSTGNFFLLRDILKEYEGRVVRFFILRTHYRKPINFSKDELDDAKNALERIDSFLMAAKEKLAEVENQDKVEVSAGFHLDKELEKVKVEVLEALDEDINIAKALGSLYELVKEGNRLIAQGNLAKIEADALAETKKFLEDILYDVLGIEPVKVETASNLTKELIEYLLELRKKARVDKNWQLSDEIRDKLESLGVKIKDARDKTLWTL